MSYLLEYFYYLLSCHNLGREETLAEFSAINWIQFYFDPFMHQLKMGHSQNKLHLIDPHKV